MVLRVQLSLNETIAERLIKKNNYNFKSKYINDSTSLKTTLNSTVCECNGSLEIIVGFSYPFMR